MSSDDDIAAFDVACVRLGGFDRRLSTESIDGYLTALAAGPRPVPFDEWLPRLAGDAFERAFGDPSDVEQATSVLRGRYTAIARELDAQALLDEPDALRLRPVLMQPDPGDDAAVARWTGALWAAGFLQALDDFADDWHLSHKVPDDEAALFEGCVGIVEALLLDDEGLPAFLREQYPGQTLSREDLIDEACFAVQELKLFWIDHAPKPAPRKVEATPGRNDPCPCGSGRKWKKCCGGGVA